MNKPTNKKWILIVIIPIIIAGSGIGGYLYYQLYQENLRLSEKISQLEQFLKIVEENSRRVQDANADLTESLLQKEGENSSLLENVQAEQAKNAEFELQLQDISGKVGTLQKLSQTDKELLRKYSKVYFLNENYIPSKLTTIDSQYLLNPNEVKQFHANAYPFLTAMFFAANGNSIDLKIVSAYRSYDEQMAIKTGNRILYGSGANQFSADQGYSEHQLGTTVDLTTSKLKILSTQFEKQLAYKWLTDNAYKFGFVLSYPKNNTYYQFEPWHWRFVGIALATGLHNSNKYFYDLTQREIDAYLISIFD